MVDGKFSDEDIEKAKTHFISNIDEIENRPTSIIMAFHSLNKLDLDMPEVLKERLKKVSREDIQNLAKKIYIDTIFLLGGDRK